MPFQTPQQVFDFYRQYFRPEEAADLNLTAWLHLEGENGGDWVFRIANGSLTIAPGTTENADFTLRATAADFLAIANGEMDAMKAYFTRKLRFTGSLSRAMQLLNRFRFNP